MKVLSSKLWTGNVLSDFLCDEFRRYAHIYKKYVWFTIVFANNIFHDDLKYFDNAFDHIGNRL